MHEVLPELIGASKTLESEERVASLAAEALAAACPRGMALVYTLRGRPARELGTVWATLAGADVESPVLAEFRRAFEWAPTFYDKEHVDTPQRNRWVVIPQEWFGQTDYRRVFWPYARMGRFLVCEGVRPLACLGILLREGDAPFSEDELVRLEETAVAIARPVRIAALLSEATMYQDAVEHLLRSRADAVVLLDASGKTVAASSAGVAALDGRPALRSRLADAALRAAGRTVGLIDRDTSLQIQITPCSPRGASTAYLARLGHVPVEGRARLTARQAELLRLLAQGLTNAAIAARMSIHRSTVKTMLELLYRRAGVSGRVGLLRWAGWTESVGQSTDYSNPEVA